jgi:hypothetical protein
MKGMRERPEEAKQRTKVILLNKHRILYGNRIKLSIFDIDVIHRYLHRALHRKGA